MKIFHGTAAIFHFLLILATCNHSAIADGLRKRQDFTFANSTVANTTRSGRNLQYCYADTTHWTSFWYVNTGAYTVRQVRFSSKHCSGREGSYDEYNHQSDLTNDQATAWSKTVATDVWDYSTCEGGKQYWDICVKIWIKDGDQKKRCFKHYAYEGNCYNSPNAICLHSGGTTNVNNSPKTYSSGSVMTYYLKERNDFNFRDGGPWVTWSSTKYKVSCSGFGVNCEFDAKGDSFKEKYCYDMGMNTCAKGVSSNNICCASSCGTCGGSGCGGRDGGTSKCCAGTITNSGKYCEHADDTACIISDYLKFTPCFDGIKSGYACCASSCGSCGGSGCADREGGANHCCDDTILESDHYCGHAGDVGCIIPEYLR